MTEIEKLVKEIKIRIPMGPGMKLSPRARYVWARLVRLPFPASASALVKWCGGLLYRTRGLASALAELKAAALVESGPQGWKALPPTGDIAKCFRFPQGLAHLSRWQDRYAYTAVTVPVDAPFKSWKVKNKATGKPFVTPENRLEVWLIWECLRGKTPEEIPPVSLLAHRLGICRKTVRQIKNGIVAFEGIFVAEDEGESPRIRSLGVPVQTQAVKINPILTLLAKVGVSAEHRQTLIDLATERKITSGKFQKLVSKAAAKHDRSHYGDDPTPLIRRYLDAEIVFRNGK